MNVVVLLAVALPLLGSLAAIRYSGRTVALLCSGGSFGFLLLLIPQVEVPLEFTITLWMNPIQFLIFVDGFSLVFALLTSFLFFMVAIYSSYMRGRSYYPLLLLDLAVLLLIAFSREILMFYVCLEVFTIVTYFLVIYERTAKSLKAGLKYVVMNVGGAFLMLLAILLETPSAVTLSFFVTGCLVKAGSFPLHVWLADAHPAAPSPVSALLSGSMVKVGAYALFRFAPHFGDDLSLVVPVGVASMVAGAFLALVQSDVKRILAYHTVSQVGFILLGIALHHGDSVSGGMLHLINHGVFKSLLFLCMGCVIYATGERTIHKLGGLHSKMPVTAAACLVGCLSITGVPPFNGAVSKCILFHALESNSMRAAFIIACAGTVASFTKLFRYTFLGELKTPARAVPFSMRLPLIVLSGGCIVLGLFPRLLLSLTGYSTELNLWTGAVVSELVLSASLGIGIYASVVKAGITSPPQLKITCDNLLCAAGRAVEYFSVLVKKWLIQDINYYAAYIMLMLILFFLLCNV
jgi:multicomponent Na+:H+ antiporter subunit D